MPTSTVGSRLAGLTFTDPQDDPGWSHARVPAADGRALPSAARALTVEVVGAGRSRGLEEWVTETSSTSLLVLDGSLDGGTVRPRVVRRGAGRRHDVPRCVDDQVGAGPSGRPGSPRRCTCADRRGDQPRPRAGGHRVRRHPGARRPHDDHGRRLVEDHRNPESLASLLLGCFADAGDSRGLLRSVRPGVAPRSRFSYCTADSQVLDWVRERATGFSYVDDVARLWKALGCTRDAYVAVDGTGVVLAGGALAAATRDWAKVALLAVDGRTDQGERLLDADWAQAAARPAYPFLTVGRLPSSITAHAGFGYHW